MGDVAAVGQQKHGDGIVVKSCCQLVSGSSSRMGIAGAQGLAILSEQGRGGPDLAPGVGPGCVVPDALPIVAMQRCPRAGVQDAQQGFFWHG